MISTVKCSQSFLMCWASQTFIVRFVSDVTKIKASNPLLQDAVTIRTTKLRSRYLSRYNLGREPKIYIQNTSGRLTLAAVSHLMWGSVLLSAASARLFVVFADVHNLPLGALSDQVSAHAGNIFKTMT